jgi:hypothetical protein
MRGQLATLIERSGQVMIQIVPGDTGANAGVGGPIALAATDDTPELLCSSALVEDHLTNTPVLVRKASATFNRVPGRSAHRAGVQGKDHGGKGEMAELTPGWRKSSHSVDNVNTNNCVEVGTAPGAVLVRDTANRAAATLTVTAAAWSTFTRSIS